MMAGADIIEIRDNENLNLQVLKQPSRLPSRASLNRSMAADSNSDSQSMKNLNEKPEHNFSDDKSFIMTGDDQKSGTGAASSNWEPAKNISFDVTSF